MTAARQQHADIPADHRIRRPRPFLAGIAEQRHPPLGDLDSDDRLAETLDQRTAAPAPAVPGPDDDAAAAAHDAAVDTLVSAVQAAQRATRRAA